MWSNMTLMTLMQNMAQSRVVFAYIQQAPELGMVHALMDFLGDSNNPSVHDVIAFIQCISK
jgi:hypothetical protein